MMITNELPAIIGPDTLLRQGADLSKLPHLTRWVASMHSSYDRTGGNGDAGNYLSLSENIGTMAEMAGPGAIVRIWAANPSSRIKIYIDDDPIPAIDTDFSRLFDGSLPPFEAPIAQTSSGGFYAYLPMTYARRCRVTLDEAPAVCYQINSVSFPPGTSVRPFALPLTASDQAALTAAKAVWADLIPPVSLPGLTDTQLLLPQQTLTLGSHSGPGIISQVRMALPDATDADLRRVVLRAYFDGHETPDIEAPVSDFFGNGFGRKPFKTLLLAGAIDGSFSASFPMPFGHTAIFTLQSGAPRSLRVAWSADVVSAAFDPARDGWFHAIWWQQKTKWGVPHIWTRVTGQRGKFVGVVQTIASLGTLGLLEGDEQFRVDDQVWGASEVASTTIGPWNGTGTEDCFNSGWYFSEGENSLAMTGVQVREDCGLVNCFRWFFNDAPTFQSSLDAQIEHGGVNDSPNNYYSSVAYWYSDGPVQPWAKLPPISEIGLSWQMIPFFILPQTIEGEALVETAIATLGTVTAPYMADYGVGWSCGFHLLWQDAGPNAMLTLTFTPPLAGTYDLVGYFTKASDYGQVAFALNGKAFGGLYDGHADNIQPSGPVSLGIVMLPKGSSVLVVTIAGKNSSSSGYNFGLDALCLNAPGSQPVPLPTPPSL